MSAERVERRLAAVLAADIVGYSRLIGNDEAGTLARIRELRRELIGPVMSEYKGRIVKTTGDGLLIEFPSVVGAVAAALAMQQGLSGRNAGISEEKRIEFRVGINLGDVIVEEGDILGEGVNVAARLEALADAGGICVAAIVRDQVEGRLDCGFDDMGEPELKNITRKVRVYRVRFDRAATAVGEAPALRVAPALVLPDKPSIAVLPFQNLSGDSEQGYFVDGMVEEIITALSRIRWLFVIACNSSFTYKGEAIDVKRVGRELGVRYLLEGSVRKAAGRMRISAQLVDAESGAHLWADRFDGSLEDVFDLQDQVASSVAGVIEPALQAAEAQRAYRRPTSDLTAYDAFLRANAALFGEAQQIPNVLALLEQAIARDPGYGPALACAASCCGRLITYGISQDRDTDRRRGTDFARRALAVGRDDASVVANAAFVLALFGGDIAEMLILVDRALTLNPSLARGWYASSHMRLWAGQLDLAVKHAEISQRLNPRADNGPPSFVIGAALFLGRDFEQALPRLLVGHHESPTSPIQQRWLMACYAHLGRLEEAREIAARLRTITSAVVPDYPLPYRNPEHRDLYLSGLRLAIDVK